MDKNKKIEELVKTIKVTNFSSADKADLRNRLEQHLEQHPVVSVLDLVRQQSMSALRSKSLILIQKTMLASIIIALIIATGGVTSVAAEGAIPGDILYPVKVNINEEVRSALNLSTDAKANWETELTNRRLQEAEKLAVANRLQTNTQSELQHSIDNHFEKFNKLSGELTQSSQAEVAAAVQSKLESILKAHAEVLLGIDGKTDDGAPVSAIAADILGKAKLISKDRGRSESELSSDTNEQNQAAAEGKQQASQNKINEVAKLVEARKNKIGVTVYQEAKLRLNDAVNLANDAEVKMTENSYSEAFAKFQEAIRKAQEAQVIINASESLKVDLNINRDSNMDNATTSPLDQLLNRANENINSSSTTGKIDIGIRAGDDENEGEDDRGDQLNRNNNNHGRDDEGDDTQERNRDGLNVNTNANININL